MRLTLRTLLAYMDENLRPEQIEELESKIQQSEAAQQLIERIREVQQRVRLGAPSIHGRGAGGDPNTVAEYLDNRLRSEKTAEIERVCMESDMQLAEVAACHRILSQILGKPLQSPLPLRDRLYAIQDLDINEGQPHADADFVRPAPHAAEGPIPAERESGSYGAWYYVLVGALSLSITLVVLAAGTYLMGGFSGDREIADGDGTNRAPVEPGPDADGPDAGRPPTDDGAQDASDSAAAGAETTGEKTTPNRESETDGDGSVPPVVDAAAVGPPGDGDRPEVVPPAPTPPGGADASSGGAGTSTEKPPVTVPPAGAPPIPPAPPSGGDSVTPPTPIKPPPGGVAVATVVEAGGAGNLVAIVDEQNVDAFRVKPGGEILTGESYVTFPLFESAVYASPFHFRFVGDSQWGFDPTRKSDPLALRLEQGNVRIVADQPATLTLRLNGHTETIRFDEPGTELAVEVLIARYPGADPRQIDSPHVADYYLLKGKAALESPTPAKPLTIAVPLRWIEGIGVSEAAAASPAPTGDAERTDAAMIPEWISGASRLPIEERAVADISAALPQDRSLKLSLTELTSDKREEVQAIAAWALCSLEYFDPALRTFSDPEQKSYWVTTLRAIRRDLPLSAETANTVRSTVDDLFPLDGEKIWQMLLGYSPERLKSSGARELVENLEHPDMPVRALAFLNLFEITDITHTYRPEVVENRRRAATQRWRQMLDAGEIHYVIPPAQIDQPTESAVGEASSSGDAPPAPVEEPPSPAGDEPDLPAFEESDAPPRPGADAPAETPFDSETPDPAPEASPDASSPRR